MGRELTGCLPSSDASRQLSKKDEATARSLRASLCFTTHRHGSARGKVVLGRVPTALGEPLALASVSLLLPMASSSQAL